MRQLFRKNEDGDIDMITTAIIAAVMFAISIPIIFSTMASVNTTTIDAAFNKDVVDWAGTNGSQPSLNASTHLISGVNTFYTIGPIYLVVVAAVGIISAILLLRGRQG